MRQLIAKITKSMLRIAICSFGGLLIILGILLGLGALLQIPEDVSNYIPYGVLAIVILSIGLYLCFLVIKPMRYFVKSRKMTKEEKAIENIKKCIKGRKSEIAVVTFFLVLVGSLLIWNIIMEIELTKEISTENIKLAALIHLIGFHYLGVLFICFLILALANEISSFKRNKHMLTLNMWERIQGLENEVKGLKAHMQDDYQDIKKPNPGENSMSG